MIINSVLLIANAAFFTYGLGQVVGGDMAWLPLVVLNGVAILMMINALSRS